MGKTKTKTKTKMRALKKTPVSERRKQIMMQRDLMLAPTVSKMEMTRKMRKRTPWKLTRTTRMRVKRLKTTKQTGHKRLVNQLDRKMKKKKKKKKKTVRRRGQEADGSEALVP